MKLCVAVLSLARSKVTAPSRAAYSTLRSLPVVPTIVSAFDPLLLAPGCCAILCGPVFPPLCSYLPGVLSVSSITSGDSDTVVFYKYEIVLCRLVYNMLCLSF